MKEDSSVGLLGLKWAGATKENKEVVVAL